MRQRTAPLLAVLLSGLIMANLDTAIVNIAAPVIRSSLDASGAELQLIVSGYLLSYAALLIASARLGQMHGFASVFIVGATLFTLASLACGIAPCSAADRSRLIQGVGASLMVAQVLSGIQLTFTGAERVKAIGSYAIALSAGAVVGQILGGVIVWVNLLGLSWRPAFLINVPVGLALIAAAARYLPRQSSRAGHKLDLLGVLVLSVALLLIVVPLTFGREAQWPVWTCVCLLASAPAVGIFIAIEQRIKRGGGQPLIDLEILRQPIVRWGSLSSNLPVATYFGLLFVLALYLQQGLGRTPLFSGLALVSWVAAFGLSGPLLKRIVPERMPTVAVFGHVILAASYLALAVASRWPSDGLLIALLGIGGVGLGLGRNATVANMTHGVPDRFAADMSGLVNTGTQLAAAAGVAIFGSLYLTLATQPTIAFAAVCVAFALAAVVAALTAVPPLRGSVADPEGARAYAARSSGAASSA
jgi:predicted MFS family arabinose efflux permease